MKADKVIIDKSVYKKMEAAAKEAYPNESCAVLLGDLKTLHIKDLKILENNAKENFFEINPLELYKLEKELKESEIVGFFHTHTNFEAVLSDEDKEYMIPGLVYTVLSLTDVSFRRIRAYRKDTQKEIIKEIELTIY